MALTRDMTKSAMPSEKAGVVTPTALLGRKSMKQQTLGAYQSDDVECPTCDSTFKTEVGMKIHHAKIHDESIAKCSVNCRYCGEQFSAAQRRISRSEKIFCSNECKGNWYSENIDGEDNHNYNGGLVKLNCDECNEVFEVKQARKETARFCSRRCSGSWQSKNLTGQDHPNWEERKPQTCENCGGEFITKPYREENSRFCSNSCRGEWVSSNLSGTKSPHWRGGKSITDAVRLAIGDLSWSAIRSRARKQSRGVCHMCGTESKSEKALDMHHIVPLSSGGDHGDYNLITLCRTCHRRAEEYIRQYPEFDPVLVE